MKSEEGFTLIEILVVASIIVFITGILVVNFSRSRTDLNQTALVVTDGIREAQALTLSGAVFQGSFRCGYGIHFRADGFDVYAGPDADDPDVDCASEVKNYEPSMDEIVRSAFLSNNVLEIVDGKSGSGVPPDIFFEPPNPTTYIGNSSALGADAIVAIRRKGATCSGENTPDCRKIRVTASGLIQSQ